jgi:flagellar hook-basal body complex protein FliE
MINIQKAGLDAYATAMRNFSKAERSSQAFHLKAEAPKVADFSETLRTSLNEVNDLHLQKDRMIQSFASGETQNVHELMISLQKAGLAMSLTAAVRNKVLEAYKELNRIQF